MIINLGGGGGNRVTVNAITSASDLPATATANTVYVVTSTAINNIVLTSGDTSGTASEGDISITIDKNTKYEIGSNHFKLKYGMKYIRQYVNGAWVGKEAYHEVDGAWKRICIWLVSNGTEVADNLITTTTFTAVCGNMPCKSNTAVNCSITRSTDYISFKNAVRYNNCSYAWIRFNINGYSKLVVRHRITDDEDDGEAILGVHSNLTTDWNGPSSSQAMPWASGSVIEQSAAYTTEELDISGLSSGDYYFFVSPHGYDPQVDIKDIWIEP